MPYRLLPAAPQEQGQGQEQEQFSCCSQSFAAGLSGSTSWGKRRASLRMCPMGDAELSGAPHRERWSWQVLPHGPCPHPSRHAASQRELVPGSSQFSLASGFPALGLDPIDPISAVLLLPLQSLHGEPWEGLSAPHSLCGQAAAPPFLGSAKPPVPSLLRSD